MTARVRWPPTLCALLLVLVAAAGVLFGLYERLRNVGNQLGDLRRRPTLALPYAADYDDDFVVIYNRIPKTGSTTLMDGIAYKLCKRNRFSVIHLNVTRNRHTLHLVDQRWFIDNITNWHERKPALYHGHLAYIDFAAFGARPPIWIQVVREPLERLASYYYFLRCGDDHRPWLKRSRHADANRTMDQCVAEGGRDCDPAMMWLQVPFFCGHAPECWRPGSQWALDEAKRRVAERYLLVGTTDRLADFVAALELLLPRMFAGGAAQLASLGARGDGRVRRTKCKRPLSPETAASLKATQVWRMERELYDFAAAHFDAVVDRLALRVADNGEVAHAGRQLHYEKVRPAAPE